MTWLNLSPVVLWLIAGLLLGAAEILVGTFYMLVMGAACLLAALAAWAGVSAAWQFSVFAVAMIAGGLIVRRLKSAARESESEAHRLQNSDVGQIVDVKKWEADGTALVSYRGAQWRAVTESGVRTTGIYRIVRVDGARLVIAPADR